MGDELMKRFSREEKERLIKLIELLIEMDKQIKLSRNKDNKQ